MTSAPRTICDLSQFRDAAGLGRILDDCVRRGLVTYADVVTCRDEIRAQGRRRTTVVDQVLESRGLGFDPGESAPELKIRTWLEDAGLAPEAQVAVTVGGRTRRLDIAFASESVCVEYQGVKTHANPTALIDDSRKITELQLAGWFVVLVTKADSRAKVVQMVRDALAIQRAHSASRRTL